MYFRARGIEPRAHRNSERKRQAEAVAAALERGVEYKVPKSHLQIQTERVSVHIGDALEMDPEPRILYPSCRIEDNIFSLPPLELPLLPLPLIEEDFKNDLDIKVKAEMIGENEFRGEILDCCNQVNGGDSDDNILNTFPIDF